MRCEPRVPRDFTGVNPSGGSQEFRTKRKENVLETEMDEKQLVSVSVSVRKEHLKALEEMAREVDGNKSLVVRKLIEKEMERRLEK